MKKTIYLLICLTSSSFHLSHGRIGDFFRDVGRKTKEAVEKGAEEAKKVVDTTERKARQTTRTVKRVATDTTKKVTQTVSREVQNLTQELEKVAALPFDRIKIHSIKGRINGKDLTAGRSPRLEIKATIPTSLAPNARSKNVTLNLQANIVDPNDLYREIAQALLKQF